MSPRRGRDVSAVDPDSVEASPIYRRYLVAAAWAEGTARNWDHNVRPVLAELVELTVAERLAPGEDPRRAARALLGPELWALVDFEPTQPPDRTGRAERGDDGPHPRERARRIAHPTSPDRPGPGREVLLRILDLLEESGARPRARWRGPLGMELPGHGAHERGAETEVGDR